MSACVASRRRGDFACAAPSGIYQNKADLLGDVVQRIGRVDGEANQNDVRIGVRQGTETVVVLLAGRIPERQLDVSAIDLDIGDVVLKHGRDVDLVPRALVCGSAVSKHGWFGRVQRDGDSRIEPGPWSDNQAGCCKAERGRGMCVSSRAMGLSMNVVVVEGRGEVGRRARASMAMRCVINLPRGRCPWRRR